MREGQCHAGAKAPSKIFHAETISDVGEGGSCGQEVDKGKNRYFAATNAPRGNDDEEEHVWRSWCLSFARARQKTQRKSLLLSSLGSRWPNCPFTGGLSWSVIQFDGDGAFVLAVIGLQLKTVNRSRVLDHVDGILHTPEFDKICARRRA